MSEQNFDQWLERQAQALPRQREPRHDLWPGIEARLPARRTHWRIPAAAAAVLVAGLAVSVWFNPGLQTPVQQPPAEPVSNLVAAAQMEREYRDALLDVVRRNGSLQLTGASRDLMETELMQIAQAQSQIRQALRLQPDAEYLVSLLRGTHAQRLNLVRNLGEKHEKTTSV